MFRIKMADFVIEIDNKFGFIEKLCKDYITEEQNVDLYASCTSEEIKNEHLQDAEHKFSDGYAESICIYRNICLQLPKYDAFIMHSAVIEVNKRAYAFAAKSGTGKSTHIALWHKYLGNENVKVINGDKPILRFIGDKLYVYGTPWCGKEGWNTNTRAELKGICFIVRDKENHIKKLPKSDSATKIMNQVLIPSDAEGAIKTLDLLDRTINSVSTWELSCNISVEAAKTAYEAMSKE